MDVLLAMRTFLAIVDEGSLTGAARKLEKAPPTVVRTLAALEDHLGGRLLTRTTRSMSLTEEGRVYVEHCRQILGAVEDAERSVGVGDESVAGSLRVTAPVLFGERFLTRPILAFAREHPEVHLDFVLLDRIVNLVEEGFDAGFRIGRLEDSSMMAVPIGTMRRQIVASPTLIESVGEPRTPADLGGLPCVQHWGSSTGPRWRFRVEGRTESVAISSRFRSNQVRAVVKACVAGLGFGSFLEYQIEDEVRAGRLRVVLEGFELEALPVQIVYADARLMTPRLRRFVNSMKEYLRTGSPNS